MNNNEGKLLEFGLFLTGNGLGLGFGNHYEDRRWENEIKIYIRGNFFEGRTLLAGLKNFLIPQAYSSWKNKEIAHETYYGWGLLGIYVDIPKLKLTSRFLSK